MSNLRPTGRLFSLYSTEDNLSIREKIAVSKPDNYYANVNDTLLDICPKAGRVLEFGCGAGSTMRAYKERNPDSFSLGVEYFEDAAVQARSIFDEVLVADAENIDLSEHGCQEESFDLIIYGDVLEHFVDPWQTLDKHLKYLKTGGAVCACIPNASHWSVILGLLNGEFQYQDSGLLDRTHLRFFTFSSIKELMENSGLVIGEVLSKVLNTPQQQNALQLLSRLLDTQGGAIPPIPQRDWGTFQYVVKAIKQ